MASEFKILAHKAKLLKPSNPETDATDSGNMLLQAYFKAALRQGLHRRILDADEPPKTLDALISRAIKLDNQWRRTNRDLNLKSGRNLQRTYTTNRIEGEEPKSVNINKLTLQEREELRKAGKCYFCKEKGHRVFDCSTVPKKPQQRNFTPKEEQRGEGSFKWDGEKAKKHIRKMGSELPDEDIDTFGQIIEESFQNED
jgi:hypothetical protein